MKKQTAQLDVFRNRVAEVTLHYQSVVRPADRVKLTRSSDAEAVLRPFFEDIIEHMERMVVICINRVNEVLGIMEVSEGGTAGTVADPKVIFQVALKMNAHGLFLAHNHPSGNKSASKADLELTKRVKEAGRLLEIQVFDHLILTKESYFSFADEGIM